VIVVDASVVLEVLLGTPAGLGLRERLLADDEVLCAPHLVDLEVTQVLRRYVVAGEVSAARGAQAVADLVDMPIERFSHEPLVGRVWELRGHLTAYDAAYVALAEALRAPLLTRDARLARARGHRAEVELA
jgi:predicted nucleic acid-binding protein